MRNTHIPNQSQFASAIAGHMGMQQTAAYNMLQCILCASRRIHCVQHTRSAYCTVRKILQNSTATRPAPTEDT